MSRGSTIPKAARSGVGDLLVTANGAREAAARLALLDRLHFGRAVRSRRVSPGAHLAKKEVTVSVLRGRGKAVRGEIGARHRGAGLWALGVEVERDGACFGGQVGVEARLVLLLQGHGELGRRRKGENEDKGRRG